MRILYLVLALIILSGFSGIANAELVTHDLMFYYDMSGEEGILATDISGNDHTGLIVGTPVRYTMTDSRYAYDFDRVDDFIYGPQFTAMNHTIEFRVMVNYSASSSYVISNTHNTNGFQVRVLNNGMIFTWYNVSNGAKTVTVPISMGRWYNISTVHNSAYDNLTIYIDGVYNTSINDIGTYDPSIVDKHFTMGATAGTNTSLFNGSISMVRAYNNSLTNAEVLQNYEYDSSISGEPTPTPEPTPEPTPTPEPSTYSAIVLNDTMPATMTPGAVYPANFTLLNTGTAPWTEATVYLAGYDDAGEFSGIRYNLTGTVATGESVTFLFDLVAPEMTGSYHLTYKLRVEGDTDIDDGVIGDISVTNTPPTYVATVLNGTLPEAMTTGGVYHANFTLRNDGTAPWTPETAYMLCFDDADLFGDVVFNLTGNVAPGDSVTFLYDITAPAAGNYTYSATMRQRDVSNFEESITGTIEVTAAPTTTPTPIPGTDHATLIANTIPTTMTAGHVYSVTVGFVNAGNISWTPADHRLYGARDAAKFGHNIILLTGNVAPGSAVNFTFNMTAPGIAGNYSVRWTMWHYPVGMIDDDLEQTIRVT